MMHSCHASLKNFIMTRGHPDPRAILIQSGTPPSLYCQSLHSLQKQSATTVQPHDHQLKLEVYIMSLENSVQTSPQEELPVHLPLATAGATFNVSTIACRHSSSLDEVPTWIEAQSMCSAKTLYGALRGWKYKVKEISLQRFILPLMKWAF